MELEDNIKIANEVQDVFDKMPPWMVRFGSVFFLIVVSLLISGGFIFKYPDRLPGLIQITSDAPPVPLIAESNGIVKFCVSDSAIVKKGELISYIENPTSFESWKKLKLEISKLDSIVDFRRLKLNVIGELGELQSAYNALIFQNNELQRHLEFTSDSFEEKSLEEQLKQNLSYKENLVRKQSILEKEVDIVRKRFEKDEKLFEKGILSGSKFEMSEEKYLNIKNKLLELKSAQILCDEKIVILQKSSKEVVRGNVKSKSNLESQLHASILSIKSNFDIHTKSYFQLAPCGGIVTYYDIWDNRHYVSQGSNVAFVSGSKDNLKGLLRLSGEGFGKVEKGQRVKVSLDSYSVAKHGSIEGVVKAISEVNIENVYTVIVELPDGLTTSYGHKLKYLPNLNGNGQVITKDMSIIERLIESILKSVDDVSINKNNLIKSKLKNN